MDIEIEISEDKLYVKMKLPFDSEGGFIPTKDLSVFLKEQDIIYGIQIDEIKNIYGDYRQVRERVIDEFKEIASKKKDLDDAGKNRLNQELGKKIKSEFKPVEVIIAKGRAPVKGEEARLEFTNKFSKIGFLREDGTIDYRNRNTLQSVKTNAVIAKYIFPKDGVDGEDVFGQKRESEVGDNIEVIVGQNVYFNKKTGEYTARLTGLLTYENDTISVDQNLTVECVNLETGNLDLKTSVVVKNNIEAGSVVKLVGDLLVEGNIETAEVSVIGNIIVKKGVAFTTHDGESKALLEATGNIEINHATNAIIKSGGTVFIHTEAMHCEIEAGDAIVMTNKKGKLVGGRTAALNSIQVNELGGSANPVTIVGVGAQHSLSCGHFVQEIEYYEKLVIKINSVIGTKPDEETRLKKAYKDIWEDLVKYRLDLAKRIYLLRRKVGDFSLNYKQEVPQVSVIKQIYTKVEMSIDGVTKKFNERTVSQKYWYVGGEIKSSDLREKILEKRTLFSFQFDMDLLSSYSQDGFMVLDESKIKPWEDWKEKALIKYIEIAVKKVGRIKR